MIYPRFDLYRNRQCLQPHFVLIIFVSKVDSLPQCLSIDILLALSVVPIGIRSRDLYFTRTYLVALSYARVRRRNRRRVCLLVCPSVCMSVTHWY